MFYDHIHVIFKSSVSNVPNPKKVLILCSPLKKKKKTDNYHTIRIKFMSSFYNTVTTNAFTQNLCSRKKGIILGPEGGQ
jgi:16S rRNA U1498 N3-methylase RsmE